MMAAKSKLNSSFAAGKAIGGSPIGLCSRVVRYPHDRAVADT
jgi:hypothetical protein